MDLFIIRHAWADHPPEVQFPDDSLRPLTDEGRERFADVVEKLVGRGFAPEVIATSPLVRCRQTAEVVAAGLKRKTPIEDRDELRPGGAIGPLLNWTVRQSRACQQVAWVGHAPDVVELTSQVVGGHQAWIRFAKGAVAAIRFDGLPELGAGYLRWMVTAKVLGC